MNKLPKHFYNLFGDLSIEEQRIFIKYQHDMCIWSNGDYNEGQAQLLVDEIRDGLLSIIPLYISSLIKSCYKGIVVICDELR